MATWQFDLYLLPRAALHARCGAVPSTVDEETFGEGDWWLDQSLPIDLPSEVTRLLPESQPWMQDMRTWGTEDGDRVDIYYKDGKIVEALVRLDLRQPSRQFIDGLIALAKRLDAILMTYEGRVLEPTTEQLIESLKSSSAARFVADPIEFLAKLDSKRER